MSARTRRRTAPRATALLSAALVLGVLLAGCGGGSVASGGGQATERPGCADYTQYGNLAGTRISLFTPVVAPADQPYIDSYKTFESCTGATVAYEGSGEFAARLPARIQAGDLPDLAFVPRPGLLASLVRDTRAVKPAPAAVSTNVDRYFPETYKSAGSVDGTLYAAPLGADVLSFVWYSPQRFAEKGYAVPTTWDEMITLSDRIVADGGTPWCAGTAGDAGTTSGGPLTGLLEDTVLRENGPDVYDRWVTHAIPFDAPQIASALDRVGTVLRNPAYVNGGLGDVSTVATTRTQDAGLPILDGRCYLHHQAGSYAANWPAGTDVSEDGAVYAFLLPPIDPSAPSAVLVGGGFVAAFSDRPEVQAFQAYLSSPEWANEKARATPAGGWVGANSGLDAKNLTGPVDKLAAQTLQDPDDTFRFDGSELMPAQVAAAATTGMADWVGGKSTADTLAAVEQAWPR